MVVMSGSHKELSNSLRFQLDLLRLAVMPHATEVESRGDDAAAALSNLAECLPPPMQPERTPRV